MARKTKSVAEQNLVSNYTIKQAAAELGLSVQRTRTLLTQDRLQGSKDERGRWSVSVASINAYKAQSTTSRVTHTPMTDDTTEFVTIKSAAQYLSCNEQYVRQLLKKGRLVGEKRDNVWFIDPTSVKEYAVTKHQRSGAKQYVIRLDEHEVAQLESLGFKVTLRYIRKTK